MIFDRLSLAFFNAQNEVKGGRMQEVVENIALEKLKPFPNHPFKIRELLIHKCNVEKFSASTKTKQKNR